MRRALCAVIAAACALAAQPVAAQDQGPGFEPAEPAEVDPEIIAALADPNRSIEVMLQLDGESVAEQTAAGRAGSKDAKARARGRLEAAQASVARRVDAAGGDVLATYQDAYNGLRVSVRAADVMALADIDGVRAVRDIAHHTPSLAQSVPAIQAPQVWEELGYTGDGISIAIIDTGIDYLHADFGGPGTEEAYASNDPTVIEDGSFPTLKVVGGYDFVGDAYDAGDDALDTPVPDPDPLDCNGHGSHVAGTAAGLGVLADGSTYTGPYDDPDILGSTEFRIAPGVAPEADLYALKVFGCDGSTNVTVDAIEWAVENEMDVINMSLGSPFGSVNDPSAVAADNAAAAGVVVVASSGNSGESPYISGSPGSSTRAISVAAQDTISGSPGANLEVDGEPTGLILQNSNNGPLPVTGTIFVLQDDPSTPGVDESLGCNLSDYPADATGLIIVAFRAVCPRVDRAIFGSQVNAEAVIFVNSDATYPPFEGPIEGADIAFLGARADQAAQIQALEGFEVTIVGGEDIPNPAYLEPADFTSSGPRLEDSAAKPDVAAPGVSIVSALVGSGDQTLSISGTSMAAPHVAGVAALLVEAHPDWSVAEIKAAIVNTADPEEMDGWTVLRAGAGVVQAYEAVTTDAVVLGSEDGTASLSYGFEQTFSGTLNETLQATLVNKSAEPKTYDISFEFSNPTDTTGVSITASPGSVTVPAGATRTVNVKLTIDPQDVANDDFYAVGGNVVFTPDSGDAADILRVPFVEVVRAVSKIHSNGNLGRNADSAEFTFRNQAGNVGTVDVYAWGLEDPNEGYPYGDIRAVGVQAFPGNDFGVFAINTWNRASQTAITEWDVLLDVDEDGSSDYAVIGIDLGAVTTGSFDGRLVSAVVDLSTGAVSLQYFAGAELDGAIVLLPFDLSAVGLSAENPDFDYTAASFSFSGTPDDFVDGTASFDVVDQPVSTGGFCSLAPKESCSLELEVDRGQLAEHDVLGWMFVYEENMVGAEQAELVPIG